jgi:hypothetical protein
MLLSVDAHMPILFVDAHMPILFVDARMPTPFCGCPHAYPPFADACMPTPILRMPACLFFCRCPPPLWMTSRFHECLLCRWKNLRLPPNIWVSLLRRTRRQTPTVWVSRLSFGPSHARECVAGRKPMLSYGWVLPKYNSLIGIFSFSYSQCS